MPCQATGSLKLLERVVIVSATDLCCLETSSWTISTSLVAAEMLVWILASSSKLSLRVKFLVWHDLFTYLNCDLHKSPTGHHLNKWGDCNQSSRSSVAHCGLCTLEAEFLSAGSLLLYAPLWLANTLYGQIATLQGLWLKKASPVVGHLITTEEILITAKVSIYSIVTLHESNPH